MTRLEKVDGLPIPEQCDRPLRIGGGGGNPINGTEGQETDGTGGLRGSVGVAEIRETFSTLINVG